MVDTIGFMLETETVLFYTHTSSLDSIGTIVTTIITS